LPEFH